MNAAAIFRKQIQTLFPAYFALVMATGVVAIASHLLQYEWISNLLFIINNIGFGLLILLSIARAVLFFPNIIADISSHDKGAGFLTIVAASNIVGIQYALQKNSFSPALFLWLFALILWVLLVYAFFVLVTIKAQKPTLEKGFNGVWLLLVVSTQSLSILGTLLIAHLSLPVNMTTFLSLCFFLLGFIFYFILITINFYRFTFFPVTADEFTPPYWIDMGAAAITTLAGATLIQSMKGMQAFQDFVPFIKTSSMLAWAISTWWIPILLILEIWRHFYKKFPLQYKPGYWSMVFPLGVYTICTIKLSGALSFPFLKPISSGFIFVAWAAWLITFCGMCIHIVKLFFNTNQLVQE